MKERPGNTRESATAKAGEILKYILWVDGQESHAFSLAGLRRAVADQDVPASCLAREYHSRHWRPVVEMLGDRTCVALAPAERHYVLWSRQRETPPMRHGELQQAIRAGTISLSTLARSAGASDWRPLSEFFVDGGTDREPAVSLRSRLTTPWRGWRRRAA
jgi:hypothetical protein